MPNRILRESICVSDSIARLDWFQEVCFYRLIVNCDDFGRMDARWPVLKGRLFPLADVAEDQLAAAIRRLEALGLLVRYSAEGKPFLYLTNWTSHQRVRAARSKFPPPDGDARSSAPVIQSESESESESESYSKGGYDPGAPPPGPPAQGTSPLENPIPAALCASEPEGRALGPAGAPEEDPEEEEFFGIALPMAGGEFRLARRHAEKFQRLYPGLDLAQELRRMHGWLLANPDKRKSSGRMLTFIGGWLGRSRDGPDLPEKPAEQPKVTKDTYHQRSYEKGFFDSFFANLDGTDADG